MSFRVERDRDGGFRLVGELDLEVADQLVEELRPSVRLAGDVRLDLSELTFIDSTGVHALVSLCKQCPSGGRIVLYRPVGVVARVLELVRADTFPNLVIEGAVA